MPAKVYLSEDGYSIRGGEPPDLRRQSESVRLMYWGWVMELALKAKDRDLARGLDKDGKPLRRISAATRRHRHSEMTPTGKGDPTAPPLEPGRRLSRVRSLLTGRAFADRAEFWWKFDPFTGESFAKILEYQKEEGRDVFGLSPRALKRVVSQAWEKYRRWEQGKPVEMPQQIGVPMARPIVAAGPTDLRLATLGINAPGSLGRFSGGMTREQWTTFFRQPAAVTIPGRPAGTYNRILGHIWGAGGPTKPKPPKPKPPKPKPPKPPKPAAKAPEPSYRLDILPGLSEGVAAGFRETIEALPAPVLEAIRRHGARFVVAEKLADYDAALAQETPRGWAAGKTWAEIEGLYDGRRKAILACRTYEYAGLGPVESSQRHGVLRHEAGHGFDAAIKGASDRGFIAAYHEDAAAMDDAARPGIAYFLQPGPAGPEELFAELFAQVHGGGGSSVDLEPLFPRAAALVRRWSERGAIG